MSDGYQPAPRTEAERRDAIRRSLRRLVSLASQFDDGDFEASDDLSTKIFILVAPHKNALKRFIDFDLEAIEFESTPPNGVLPYRLVEAISRASVDETGASTLSVAYEPRYDRDGIPFKKVSFNTWYKGEYVFQLSSGGVTREQLIEAVRHKDGGAHLDPDIKPSYAAIKRQEEFRVAFTNGPEKAEPLVGAQDASIRQIAFELQLTLKKHLSGPLSLDFDLAPPAPPQRMAGAGEDHLRIMPNVAHDLDLLCDMGRSGKWDEQLAKMITRRICWRDSSIGPRDMTQSLARAKEARAQAVASTPSSGKKESREPAVPYNVLSDEYRQRNK